MTNDDKLDTHKAQLLDALRERPSRLQQLAQLSANIQGPTGPEDTQRWATDCVETVNGALADVYRRIAVHADSIMQLADDERAKALATKLGSLASAQITDLRDAAGELGSIKDVPSFIFWKLKWFFGGIFGKVRETQIVAATAEAEAYFSAA